MESLQPKNYSVLKYRYSCVQLNKLHLLVVCDEPQAKLKIAKALADVETDFFVDIHTTKVLPMKNNASSQNFEFLVFMIDMSKRSSQMNIEESLQFVDVNYFLRQSCFVAIHNTDHILHSCDLDDVKKLERKYNIPVFHANFSDSKSVDGLARRIINLTSIACRLQGAMGTNYIEASSISMQNPLDNPFLIA